MSYWSFLTVPRGRVSANVHDRGAEAARVRKFWRSGAAELWTTPLSPGFLWGLKWTKPWDSKLFHLTLMEQVEALGISPRTTKKLIESGT